MRLTSLAMVAVLVILLLLFGSSIDRIVFAAVGRSEVVRPRDGLIGFVVLVLVATLMESLRSDRGDASDQDAHSIKGPHTPPRSMREPPSRPRRARNDQP